jgi:molybdopterin converting factor small subunit
VKFLATIRVITSESSIELLCTHHDTADTVMQMLVEKYKKKFEQVIIDKTNLKSSIWRVLHVHKDILYPVSKTILSNPYKRKI